MVALTMLETGSHSDLSLVQDVMAGDSGRLEELLELLGRVPAMVRAKHARLGSPLDADELDDVVQDTVASVWKKLATYRGDSALSTWIFGFAVRELFKGIQRRARTGDRRVGWDRVDPARLAVEGSPPNDGEVEALHTALEELDGDAARILRAKHFNLWTFERIAAEWRIPLGTAKTRYYHAAELLRAKLAPAFRSAR